MWKIIEKLGAWALAIFAVYGIFMLADKRANAAEVDDWTTPQIVAEGVAQALTFVDYRQTLQIKNSAAAYQGDPFKVYKCGGHCTIGVALPQYTTETYSEINPLLGQHPSDRKIRNYFIVSDVAVTALAYVLPSSYRSMLLGGQIGVEAIVVHHNAQIGLSGRF